MFFLSSYSLVSLVHFVSPCAHRNLGVSRPGHVYRWVFTLSHVRGSDEELQIIKIPRRARRSTKFVLRISQGERTSRKEPPQRMSIASIYFLPQSSAINNPTTLAATTHTSFFYKRSLLTNSSCSLLPRAAGDLSTRAPALSKAAILLSAPPLPPLIMAPA